MKKFKNKRRKKSNQIFLLFTIIFLAIFIYSAYKIVLWKIENDKGNKTLTNIKKDIKIIKNIEGEIAQYKIDFSNLKKKNNDTVAFIKVKGTNIEYPIVKTNDNSYYLTHSFDKSPNGAGWPFANYLNKFDGTDKNITIFAHARYDGSMFGTLYKTLSTSWQENKDNHKILFITENGPSEYQVFSTYKILAEDYYIKENFSSDEEYQTFLTTITKRSNYNYNVDVTLKDTIITLSSCASDDKYRIVLHAKKIEN
jgi:sortase B